MANPEGLNIIRILAPEVQGQRLILRWAVDPRTTLYRKCEFSMKFPVGVELGRVPEGLLWRLALICLHSQWALLRPCRVEIPIGLLPGEKELWDRLIHAELATLNAYSDRVQEAHKVEIVADGPNLKTTPVPISDRCATSFSGGKDSLLQTGLLAEFTERPVLVTTTSPMPPLEDHLTERRRQILNEITGRVPVDLIEVDSDYRANFDHGFAQERGYQISVNEITDAFLYLGSLVVTGAALGVGHLFLASELEVQENVTIGEEVIQHPHFMYSVATQYAIGALLKHWGMTCSSMTAPLHSYQVQELLSTRYANLRDLQYSCWRVRMGEMACNACSQCLRVAFSLLAIGQRPSMMGMNVGRILRTMRKWQPKRIEQYQSPMLPRDTVSVRLHAQVMRSILAAPKGDVVAEIGLIPSKRIPPLGRILALAAYRRLRRSAKRYAPGPSPGYCPEFLEFVDPLVREQVAALYARRFAPHQGTTYTGTFERCRTLSHWIAEPLESQVLQTTTERHDRA